MVNHAGVRVNDRQLRRQRQPQVDGLAHEHPEHLGDTADGLVQIQEPGLHELLAAEHKQLPGEIRRPVGRKGYLLQRLVGRPAQPGRFLHQTRMALMMARMLLKS